MVNIAIAQQIPGWMLGSELLWLAEAAQDKTNILEVGPWKGKSTRAIADNSNCPITVVDSWAGPLDIENYAHDFDEAVNFGSDYILNQFKANLAEHLPRIRILKMYAKEAYELLLTEQQKFDMIFIDATQTFAAVKEDIEHFRQLLSEGGLLCGHDYSEYWPGVIQAVQETLPKYAVAVDTSIWYMI